MNMLGRSISWATYYCPRLLFAASIIMLLAGIVQFATFMTSDFYYFVTAEHVFLTDFGPAAWLLFAAVLTDRLARR